MTSSPPRPSSPDRGPMPMGRHALDVMVIDDDDATCALLETVLARAGMKPHTFTDGREALASLDNHLPAVIVTDLEMEGVTGLDILDSVRSSHPDIPVVVVTGHADLDHAVSALRVGAYDFLTKPLDIKRLVPAIERAGEHHNLRAEVARLRSQVRRTEGIDGIIGSSAPMRAVFDLVARVARTEVSVLITGESGTGKELVARALHERSGREGPFIPVNCAAVPANLIESELFGHTKGAFTDAHGQRPGLFAEAEGGTLFLDEIGELPIEVQPKLLRALQERKVRPVGGDREIPFDARIITATNRDLSAEVEKGRFREDLYYRINVVNLPLPPLSDRGTDVLALAQHFLERIADRYGKEVVGLGPEVAKQLLAYPWPGNVRELENCMDRAVALARYDRITLEELPANIKNHTPSRLPAETDEPEALLTLGELEARYIRKVLRTVDGNKSHAARVLGIDRRTLYRKLDRMEDDS